MTNTTTRTMGSNSVIMILVRDGKEIGRTRNERKARVMARENLGCQRVSEYPTERGWAYYPTGDADENCPTVNVVCAGSPETRI